MLLQLNIIGQKKNLIFDHYSDHNGFTTSQSLNIAKDKQGYVWIGTENGLARFDGHRFKYFKHDINDSSSIRNNYIRNISLDKHDRLWMATGDFYGYFDTKINKIVQPQYALEKPKDVAQFYYDKEKDRTYIISGNGLFTITGSSSILDKINLKFNENVAFSSMCIIDEKFYLCGIFGIYVFNKYGEKIKVYHRPGSTDEIPNDDDFNFCYYEKQNKNIYIGGWTQGLFVLNIETGEMRKLQFNIDPKFHNGIHNIYKYDKLGYENKLLLATVEGAMVFDIQTNKFSLLSDFGMPNKTKIDGMGFSFCDGGSEGLWIGTHTGLYKEDPNKQIFEIENIPFIKELNLNTLFVDQHTRTDSLLWGSYQYATIFKYDLINKKMLPLPPKIALYNKSENLINGLFMDSKHRLWIPTEIKGILLFEIDKDILTIPSIPKYRGSNLNILHVYEDKNNTIYFSSIDGLFYFDEPHNRIVEVRSFMKFLQDNQLPTFIRDVSFDSKNRLWATALSFKNKEQMIYFAGNNFSDYKLFRQKDYKELKELEVFESIKCLANDEVLITSFFGLGVMSYQNGILILKNYTQFANKALLGSRSNAMDQHKNIWYTTDNSLARFNISSSSFSFYNKRNSAWDGNSNAVLYFSDKSQTLYLSQKNHLLYHKIDTISPAITDKIILTDVSISNLKSILPSSFENIVLTPSQSTIKLYFSNMNFTNAENSYYEYRMNEDTTWTGLEGSELLFNKIGFGKYMLEVRSYNYFGEISAENYKVKFEVLPPFYRTWWFQSFLLFLVSLILFAIFKYRENQTNKLAKIRLNIARDLHDDLGSNLSNIKIISELEAAKNIGKDKDIYSNIAEKSRTMMGSISDIVWSINPNNDNLEELIYKVKQFSIDTLEKMNIDLHFDVPDHLAKIQLPIEYRRHIYLISKEAINNIAKYSNAHNMQFIVNYTGKKLQLIFKDDGIGFDENYIKLGNGLNNMKSRTKEMKGQLQIFSSNKGTSIQLSLIIP